MRARICLLEARHLGGGRLVARIVLSGEPELAAGGVELSLCLEFLRAIEVLARRGDHRALEGDLVCRIVGIALDRDTEVGDGLVRLAETHRVVALAVGAARSTAAGGNRQREHQAN